MSSFLFRQVDECDDCGDCTNGAGPEYYASVVGVKRVGGVPPLPVWVEVPAGNFYELVHARPSGTNNAVWRTFELTRTFPNDSGGVTTIYNKAIFHPIMGDYYWGIENKTSDPARMDDYTYEWKLSDRTSSGAPVVTITDPDGTGNTHRPNFFGATFGDGDVVEVYAFDELKIHSASDPRNSAHWVLSDPYTMQAGLTDVTNSAQSACDEIDILSDNVSITMDDGSTVTSNLTSSTASPRYADLVRVAARRDAGVVMRSIDIMLADDAVRNAFGTIVARYATQGNVIATSCNMAVEADGGSVTSLDQFMWSWIASKMKFALKTEGWCFKTWKLQTTPFTFEYSLSGGICCGCDPAGIAGTVYDTVDLKWVIYSYVDIPDCPPCSVGDPCAEPGDVVLTAALVDCSSYGHADGNIIGQVTDLPEPCASETQPCVGDIWYYDYTMSPLLGFIAPDMGNCGTNCNCGITSRAVLPNITVPPTF